MKNTVTSKQMMYASAVFIISTSLLTKALYAITKSNSWIPVITGFLVAFIICLIYAALAHRFPDKTIIEINNAVFGRALGTIVSVLDIYFILTIACLDTNIISSFVKAIVLHNTPTALIIFLFIFICAWAVRKGPVNLMKYSALLVYLSIFLLALIVVLLYKNIDLRNLLPVFNLRPSDYIVGTHSIAMIPFCDVFVLIMFLPDMQKPKDFGKSIVKGISIGAAFLLIVVIRDISVLGGFILTEDYPTFAAVRLIDVGDIFTRIEIIYVSIFITLMFYKVALLFYAAVSGVQRLVKFGSYQTLITIFGAALLLYSLVIVRSGSEHTEFLLSGAAHIHHTFFLVILPLLTLITAALRGFFKSDNQDSAGLANKEGQQL